MPLVVNDRPDLARLAEADYVHVGQDDLPVEAARTFGVRVGQSTHAPVELDAVEADYAGVGPVYATPTKEGRPAVGLDYVRYAAGHARVPWFAIGGIDETNVAEDRRRRRDEDRGRPRDRRSVGSRSRRGGTAQRSSLIPKAASLPCRGQFLRPIPGSSIGRASGC